MEPLLIVDDEPAIADLIAMTLDESGYRYDIAHDGITAADLMEKNNYSLLLLDIMLPGADGYDLLEYARPLGMPVIFITAKGELADRVKGLRLGADDYITKPFEPQELLARVQTVLRRTGQAERQYHVADVTLDTASYTVTKAGVPVPLTPREFTLLCELVKRPGRVLTRDFLYESVWGDEADFDSRTLDLHITRLRKKLGWQDKIRTQYKIGYMLEVGP